MSRATDEALAAVTRATEALGRAELARDQAVIDAHAAGAAVAAIAVAGGMSRPTVYRIVKRAAEEGR